jgi:hypothetical protein
MWLDRKNRQITCPGWKECTGQNKKQKKTPFLLNLTFSQYPIQFVSGMVMKWKSKGQKKGILCLRFLAS